MSMVIVLVTVLMGRPVSQRIPIPSIVSFSRDTVGKGEMWLWLVSFIL